jgi:lipopolysaccharide export system protein LptA
VRGGAAIGLALATLLVSETAAAQGAAARPRGGSPSSAAPKAGTPAPAAPGGRNAPVTIDADRLEAARKEGLVVFIGNVVARQDGSTQYADRMEIYLDAQGERILRTVSTGAVRIITKDCRMGTARRAEYYDEDQRIILIGNARAWQDDNVVTGDRITIYLAEDRSVVEGGKQDRVKAIFHPRREEGGKTEARPGAGAPCS